MSVYELRTIDGQSVLARVNAAAGVLEAAKTASMQTALNMLTAYTDLPYGFYDTFSYDTESVIPVMTDQTTSGTTITARSLLTGYSAWKACNRIFSVADAWVANAAPTPTSVQWLRVSRATTGMIGRYTVWNRDGTDYIYEPNSYQAFISTAENPSNYTNIADYENDPNWTQFHALAGNTNGTALAKIVDYTLPAPLPWKHLTIACTARNGTAARVCIGNLFVYPGGEDANTYTNAVKGDGFVTPTGEAVIASGTDSASTAPTHAMGMIWLDAKGATVTDELEGNNAIRLSISRDGGTTWDWLPLTDGGAVSGDVRLYSCPEKLLTATSGTAIKLKLTTHDLGSGAPDFELHGWGCVYNEGA